MKTCYRSLFDSRLVRAALLVSILPLFMFLSGCGTTQVAAGTGTGGGGGAAAAPTVLIAAAPATIAAGTASVLSVTANNATQVTIKGSDGSSYTLPNAGGSQSVTPVATTTYTATATGAAGTTPATANVVVTVTPAAAATITISANPATIAAGGSSVLTVSATNASTVTLTGTDGSSYPVALTGGMVTVKPTATTTYTASAVGAPGSAPVTQTAVVTVTPVNGSVPTVAINANPPTVSAGLSSLITVTATNATTVTLTGTDGTIQTLQPSGGTFTVTPATPAVYTYTATATGAGGSVSAMATLTVTAAVNPTVTIMPSPATIITGSSANLVVSASNATSVTITSPGNPTLTLPPAGGTKSVTPTATTTYTVTANGPAGTTPATATATVTVNPAGSLQSVKHVVFLLQENHTFDNYFGMLNPYKVANGDSVGDNGKTYLVDGIDDKLGKITNSDDPVAAGGPGDPPFSLFKFTSTCIDDLTSAWLESYGDVSRYDFSTTRPIAMDGFVHTAEGFEKYCANAPAGKCSGSFTDTQGKRAMGYYDEGFLNYYYYMASNFALSDRWFSPVSSKSVSNRIATYTGGTTQGLISDPGNDDNLPQLGITTFFSELNANHVSWKIYYTATDGGCTGTQDCSTMGKSPLPATDFSYLSDANNYIRLITPQSPTCPAGFTLSTQLNDSSGSFCLELTHVAPLSQYYTDLQNGTLPSYTFIEAGYGVNDEHPGSNQSILNGQKEVASLVNALMGSSAWSSSVFFLAYDEGGGPYDHVPPVPGSSNINTDANLGTIPDIGTIAVAADNYKPCLPANGTPTTHCDLAPNAPGANATDPIGNPPVNKPDDAYTYGFPAQLGFRVPNMIISPFTRKHYVSHAPMDHTAVLKFVEEVFIPNLATHFTPRVAAQPDLTDFFDFNTSPWLTPPANIPTPVTDPTNATCHATIFDR